jgi:hypothetical protein
MARFEITTPVADYNGFSAGINFTGGKAVVSSDTQAGMSALAYFRGAGYGILALDEVLVDEVLNRANEDPATEAARLRREIADLEDRESLDDLRRRRDDLHAKVYGDDADPDREIAAWSPRQEGEAEIQATLSPGSANYAEGDAPAASTDEATEGELLAPPNETAPVSEWRAWVVASGRASADDVAGAKKNDIIAEHGAAYDRDREAQLSAGSDEGGNAPREGDAA